MIIIKKIYILPLLILVLFQISCSLDSNNSEVYKKIVINDNLITYNYSEYLGDWYYEQFDTEHELISTLSINIEHISDAYIKGEYCYIGHYGGRIDCDIPFEGKAINNGIYEITFYSSFDNIQGTAKLIVRQNNIIWELLGFSENSSISAPIYAELARK